MVNKLLKAKPLGDRYPRTPSPSDRAWDAKRFHQFSRAQKAVVFIREMQFN
jgi:hypothetical protein